MEKNQPDVSTKVVIFRRFLLYALNMFLEPLETSHSLNDTTPQSAHLFKGPNDACFRSAPSQGELREQPLLLSEMTNPRKVKIWQVEGYLL